MKRKFLVILAACFMALALAQCMSVQQSDSTTVRNKGDIKDIIKHFNAVCLSMLKGDTKTVYDNYLSTNVQKNESYDAFAQEYNSNTEYWKKLFSGAMLKQISPENKIASAIVVWGGGQNPSLIEFVKSNDDIWKINSTTSPAGVFEHSAGVPENK